MNTFKRKALFTAVLATVGAAGTAEAVYLNPNGTGQVLVYPYYTVQSAGSNAWNTYISVVNTTGTAKAVKVRFLEGKTSSEVLDFNLFLSPNDVWTGAVIPASSATGAPAHLITADASCTSPNIGLTGVDFRNFQYAGGAGGSALPGVGLDRTREGYVEMIEMASLTGTTATNITHVSGVPLNCTAVRGATFVPPAGDLLSPTGGLMGTGTLINVNNGQDAGYKADALEAFSNIPQYTAPTSTFPALDNPSPAVSLVVNAGTLLGAAPAAASMGVTAYLSDFTTSPTLAGARAVASVYMHSAVMNEYVLDAATASNTDWVVTQPLKNRFVSNTTAVAPYTATLTAGGACETVSFTYFNREEQSAAASGVDFSPPPPTGPANSICWESNVLSIRNGTGASAALPSGSSGVLGSVNNTNININSSFQNGWALLAFTGTNATGTGLVAPAGSRVSLDNVTPPAPVTTAVAPTFFGLPVTGFMIRNFANGSLTCGTATCQGNYGSLFNHSYRNTITP
ncbi:MAG TPA: hypothetical protein VFE23_18390 [Usitatibacter sp.]|jgi:hypothetical protein|nr:hypothetical protein [Usitatibacter sp.]